MDLVTKYRPRRPGDLVGQEEVARKVRDVLRSDGPKVCLLVGSSGTGKSVTAKIVASMKLCRSPLPDGSPCLECSKCRQVDAGQAHDFKVISAAENGGVAAASVLASLMVGGFDPRVLFIDEVHRLTRAGLDALLVALENVSPSYVVLLGTDRPQSLPPRFRHRATTIEFNPPSDENLRALLRRVCEAEGLPFTNMDEALLIRASERSFRGLLRQIQNSLVDGRVVTDHLRRADIETAFAFFERAVLGASVAMQLLVLETWKVGVDAKFQALAELHDRLIAVSLNAGAAFFPYPELDPPSVASVVARLARAHGGRGEGIEKLLLVWSASAPSGPGSLQASVAAFSVT